MNASLPSRESAEAKGRRYLVEGRLRIHTVDGASVIASCRGSGEVHWQRSGPTTGWHCSCPARGRCAHLIALGLVVAVEGNPAA
jgi:uncharacterized Zn finger protein